MDYVLFGMGYGATLMLLGWALRTFGPERKYKSIHQSETDLVIQQRNWVRFIQGLGGVIAIAGSALVALTFVVMLINPSDETGSIIAVVVWAFLVVAVLIWCWFYVGRFGTLGLWAGPHLKQNTGLSSRKSTSRLQTSSTSITSTTESTIENTATSPVDTEPTVYVPAEQLPDEATSEVVEFELEPDTPENTATEVGAVPDSTEPEYDFGDSTDTTVPSEVGGRAEAIRRLRERQARTSKNQG